jgi:hypothetical protein
MHLRVELPLGKFGRDVPQASDARARPASATIEYVATRMPASSG